ncbi:MAG: hypothetical protein CMJ64_02495 [Planctomycetaceae bacterium]|nr:hypothetical protein [Planctomycetaceae bacterium]
MMSAEKFLTFGMMLTLFVVIGCSQSSDAPSKSTTGNSSGATESVPAASKPSSADNETAASAQAEPPADSVIDTHIRAVGGAEAIARIKTIHRTGTISGQSSHGPLSGTVEEIFDLSKNRGYTSMELTGYSRKTGWTGDSGWVSDTQAGITELPADEAAFAKYIGGLSPLVAIHGDQGIAALKEAGEKEFNGKKCAVVSVDETPIEFFINQETNLLEGMTIPGDITMTFEEYKTEGALQFPGKRTMNIEAQKLTMVYEYKTTNVNDKIDVAKFDKPSASSAPATGSVAAERIISFMDKNGDGKISKEEASEELKPNFQFIDTNGDGAIDAKEAQVMADYAKTQDAGTTSPASPTGAAASSGPVTAEQIISSMDKNGDGNISKDEASEDLKLFFGQHDANKAGAIDAKEAQALVKYVNNEQAGSTEPAPKTGAITAQQIISYMDTNGDGKISKDEASEDLKPHFEQIDTNGDGAIDAKEAQVMAEYANKESSK